VFLAALREEGFSNPHAIVKYLIDHRLRPTDVKGFEDLRKLETTLQCSERQSSPQLSEKDMTAAKWAHGK